MIVSQSLRGYSFNILGLLCSDAPTSIDNHTVCKHEGLD